MASVEVACIDDYFPDVILGKILRHCPSDCYKTLRSVSKRWNQVVDRFVGRLLVVKCGNKYVLDFESHLDKFSIKGNFWVTLSPNMEDDDSTLNDLEESKQLAAGDASSVIPQKSCGGGDVPLPVLPNADQVRKVGFVGDIDYKSLEYFLGECKNVTGVYLHLSGFARRKEEEHLSMSNLTPFLEELVIDSAGIQGSKLFNYRRAFRSLTSFLEDNQFPFLKKFIFRVPFFEKREGRMSRAVSFFLGKHSATLKSFSFHQKYDACEEDSDSDEEEDGENDGDKEKTKESTNRSSSSPSSSKSSNAEDDTNFLSLAKLGESAMELKKVQLEDVHIVLCHKQESDPLWKNMLLHQASLRKCIFAGSKIPCPVKSIEANGQTLVTLKLDIRDSVNLECFRNCNSLKYLSLGGLKESEYEDGEEDVCEDISFLEQFGHPLQLRNGHCLPSSLESVELMNLRTHKDDLRFICVDLPHVRDLILKNLGWEGSLGLRLMDLAQLWNLRKVDHFLIKASLNMASYSELEEKEDSLPEVNLLACLIQSNSFAAANRFFLDVWKMGSGMYTTDKSKLGLGSSVIQNQGMTMETESTDVFEIPSCVALNEDEDESEEESESEDEEEDESQEEEDDASDGYESVRDSLGGEEEEEADTSAVAKTS